MNELQKYFIEGIDHLLDEAVLAVRVSVSGTAGEAMFFAFVLSCGLRRIRALFTPAEMTDEESAARALSVENISSLTDVEIAQAFCQFDPLARAKFIIAMRQADCPSSQRLEAILAKMESSEVAAREQAKTEIVRKAQEDANRVRKAAEEKAELEWRAAEAKRRTDEKVAKERSEREDKAQAEREAKFRQYLLIEFLGTRDIVQLATRKLEKIKEFRGSNGVTPDWQLAIIREVAWQCEGELRATPSFLSTDKVELEAYIAKLDQEAKDLQPETSKVITGAHERQLKLARQVLADINAGKVIRFPEGGRDGTPSEDAAKERAERESKREERRERDRQARKVARGSSNEVPLYGKKSGKRK
ncbi:MAG TPA: hypothetical protein DEB73_01445 [Candidatus Magasanikbacteria bacterium]|uniref:Kinetoplast-associated protein (KAP) n=1 Tax=Candidatus Magasanikbacteria bacterium GW2011_GWC2_41_17 TaxID=1619048 RepID=A0A0G0VDW8_9BACT|nr:MAG: Kinetoplast-associated protein (KAP) [Candidatus Magasanikbacteria bacterium GW2011_GWC2_41_17]HBV57913.1 hypothetical protein [Candidatus Magasanikbacteria bacterium]